MEFSVEKFVSPFIENQFPQFYQEEGPDFILFMKAYYEYLEDTGNPIAEARKLFDYRDIDNTLEDFLEFFQKKYLYGIPFNVIANKRFLLKHILDVYRSKGTIQCYRLLFKLLYNEDIEIYLPGRDILRASDGTYVQPRYIEVTYTTDLANLIGKTVVGTSSGTTAVVENFVRESFNRDTVNVMYISNILPKGGDFNVGEKIVPIELTANTAAITAAPTILGSLIDISVTSGGQGFRIGDTVKIAQKEVTNNNIVISYGVEGMLRVAELSRGNGALAFDIRNAGFGYLANAETFIYNDLADLTGQGASFEIGSISSTQYITYNTDLICDYANLTIDSVAYGLSGNASANSSSQIGPSLSYSNNLFGSILSLTSVQIGNSYQTAADVFVRSTQFSKILSGNVSFNTGSNTVTGTDTLFQTVFENNDVIALQTDPANTSTIQLEVIREVISNTSILLYGPPSSNSIAGSKYRAAPTILPSNYATYESVMARPDDTINGENEEIVALLNTGNNTVSKLSIINSGKGYVEGEEVKLYLFGAVSNNITIANPGISYTNGDLIIFAGGEPGSSANGFVTTDSNGSVVGTTLSYAGSGYGSLPNLRIKTSTGSGAVLNASLTEFNTSSFVTGRVVQSGIGRGKGYFATTKGFLNSDKYIHDSYYYQDYSYEIRVAQTLNKYRDILYNTFHSAGSELFGKYLLITRESSEISILEQSSIANTDDIDLYLISDSGLITSDSSVTVDTVKI